MEHRHGQRHPARFPAHIWHRGHDLGVFWIRNLSSEGALLGPVPPRMHSGAYITMTILFPGDTTPQRLTALVRHVSHASAGIMFVQEDPVCQAYLERQIAACA